MPINSFLYPGAKVTKGYDVANSLRFNDGSQDSLSRTPSSAGNRRTWTWSSWIKRSALGTLQYIFAGGSANTWVAFLDTDKFQFNIQDNDESTVTTTQLFRDVSSWYHIVAAIDTTQGTASNRVKVYVNGSQVTDFSTEVYPSQNYQAGINNTGIHYLGRLNYAAASWFDGYMAETVLIDGQQLDPTSFGEFDEDSPTIWKPKDVSGLTFGTNGFYQEYKQSGTSANSSGLGADTSGNDHHFTVNNLTAVDQSLDTCTNNFAVLNALVPNAATYSEGNLKITTSSNWESSGQSIPVTQGKWYGEFIASSNSAIIGVEDFDLVNTWSVLYFGSSANGVGYWNAYSGQLYKNNSYSSYAGGAFDSDDIVGIYLDMDNKYVYFSINGAMQNSGDPSSGSSGTGGEALSGTSYVMGGGNYTGNIQANFGAPPFAISSGNQDANGYGNFEYNPTYSGVNYYSLNTKNLAEFG